MLENSQMFVTIRKKMQLLKVVGIWILALDKGTTVYSVVQGIKYGILLKSSERILIVKDKTIMN